MTVENQRKKYGFLRQSLQQAAILLAVACALAVGTNYFRRDGIAWVGDGSSAERFAESTGQNLVVDLAEARRLSETGAALLLDARPGSLFALGHIRGALNLPWHEVDRRSPELAERLEKVKTIIVYCDGENCELSHELALFLKDMNYPDVRVLVNGWSVWQNAGLPTAVGE
jgi:rhodanese-related sulfurtransferase